MALVTVRAAVDIPVYAAVVRVSLVLAVANGAGKDRVVRGVGMARGANSSRIAVVGWEPRVVEARSRPRGCGVAGLAGGRETRRRVIRVGGGLVIRLVTGEAVGRNRCVVVVHVTTGAGHSGVLAGQRERGVVMVERGRNPGGRVMADVALLRKS